MSPKFTSLVGENRIELEEAKKGPAMTAGPGALLRARHAIEAAVARADEWSKFAAGGVGLGIAGSSLHCALVSWSRWKLFAALARSDEGNRRLLGGLARHA